MLRNQTVTSLQTDRPLPALPEARPAGQTITSDVIVPALQNLLGGAGAGLVVERVLTLWFFIPDADIVFLSVSVGMLVFGLATAVRAFRDEWVLLIHAWAERRNRQDFSDMVEENGGLRLQIVTLQSEIDRLQARDGNSADGVVIQMAYRFLADYYLSALPFTQKAILERKLCSRQVWDIVTGFFRKAGIIDGNGGVIAADLSSAFGDFMRVHVACTHAQRIGGKMVKCIPPTGK